MTTLFSANSCPFAQRTRALLERLREPYQVREVDLSDRDPELLERSPTGKVPFLIDGDVTLFESSVINDYLAEKLGYYQAYSNDLEMRSLQRLFMRRWDEAVVPAFYKSLASGGDLDPVQRSSLRKELVHLNEIAARMGDDVDHMAGIHAATHWARMDWVRAFSELPWCIDEQEELRRWLDRAVSQPVIQDTLPKRSQVVERYRRMVDTAAG